MALKGIIRLQALIRGSLVRRQAVATLSCMRAIVEFQAHARGRMVRLSGDAHHVLQKVSSGELVVISALFLFIVFSGFCTVTD